MGRPFFMYWPANSASLPNATRLWNSLYCLRFPLSSLPAYVFVASRILAIYIPAAVASPPRNWSERRWRTHAFQPCLLRAIQELHGIDRPAVDVDLKVHVRSGRE